jgi:hypothetical protein
MKPNIVLLHPVAVLLATIPPVEAQQPKKVPPAKIAKMAKMGSE